MKIAIIGGGFSGIGIAYALYQQPVPCEVTLIDPNGIGGEASKMSTGLLHPYVGLKAKLNPYGLEGYAKTVEMVRTAEKALQKPVILSKGILRIAISDEQAYYYKEASSLYKDVKWLSADEVIKIDPHLPYRPAILIETGLSLDVENYILGMEKQLFSRGLLLEKRTISSLEECSGYDLIFLATGAIPFPGINQIKMHQVKGQLIELALPEGCAPLPFSLMGEVYMTMHPSSGSVIVGATYEHTFHSPKPEPAFAMNELLPKAFTLYPPLKNAPILNVRAGLRASTPSRLPFAGKIQEKCYALVGMGSRGMLYHGYFAEKLVNEVLSNASRS